MNIKKQCKTTQFSDAFLSRHTCLLHWKTFRKWVFYIHAKFHPHKCSSHLVNYKNGYLQHSVSVYWHTQINKYNIVLLTGNHGNTTSDHVHLHLASAAALAYRKCNIPYTCISPDHYCAWLDWISGWIINIYLQRKRRF